MKEESKLEIMRHSAAHLMAAAVLELFPETKFGIGPVIENGFYYDLELPSPLTLEDLLKIEKKMKEMIAKDLPFEKEEISIDQAIKLFKKLKQDYKIELLDDLKKHGTTFLKDLEKENKKKAEKVTLYRLGEFLDLCRGPHLASTKEIKFFKLHKLAGAYWRGDEKNQMLTRVYGLAFEKKEELENYLKTLEEAEKRDHRKLGKDLELFFIDPLVGLGLPLWMPKGALIWRLIEDYWYGEHLKSGYQLVRSPHLGQHALWETSGHWNFYNSSMYPSLEIGRSLEEAQKEKTSSKPKEEYLIKPMNCPFHIQIYKSRPWSYRDLPLRWAECGVVYRYEKSGEISGLTRVRGFTQDDAHIICSKDQVENELSRVIKFIKKIFSTFGFEDYKVYLSLRDPKDKKKYAGDEEGWNFTEKVLEKAAKEENLDCTKEEGEAVFYGPKLDFKIKDVLGREWQCSTLQFDFNLPERFKMFFKNSQGKEEKPYMLHRALFGSFERFMGLLIEHYAGAFPLWLSPTQVQIIPVGNNYNQAARELAEEFQEKNIRAIVDESNETVGNRIRKASKEKIPYILVLGEKEVKGNSLNVRIRGKEEIIAMSREDFFERIEKEIKEKTV